MQIFVRLQHQNSQRAPIDNHFQFSGFALSIMFAIALLKTIAKTLRSMAAYVCAMQPTWPKPSLNALTPCVPNASMHSKSILDCRYEPAFNLRPRISESVV